MTLRELRDKIDEIIEQTPSWADVNRVGIVTASYDDGSVDMEMLVDLKDICCDGHGMVAFQLVLEDDEYFFGDCEHRTVQFYSMNDYDDEEERQTSSGVSH